MDRINDSGVTAGRHGAIEAKREPFVVRRTFDSKLVNRAVENQMGKLGEGFDASRWLQNHENLALVSGEDVALFKGHGNGIYEGHWVFSSRGKVALAKAKEVVRVVFQDFHADKIWGLTPAHCRAARIFNRKLCREVGGGSHGLFNTDQGWQELFVLEKQDWTGV